MRKFVVGAVAGVMAFVGSLPAHAQSAASAPVGDATLEEIVVTAEHRDSSVQHAALAVTTISGEEIERGGNTDIAQVLQNVPNLVMQNVSGGNSTQSVQGSGAPPNIAIRGLGTDGPNRAGAVAVYQDGILLQGGGGNSFDLSRVEVLRGPQGTLYGRGATAGAVNFITNNPGNDFEAGGRVQFGSYNLVSTQGMLNVPMNDVFSLRVAFNQLRHDGYFPHDQNNADEVSTRVKLRFSPNDSFSVIVGGATFNSDATPPGAVDVRTNPVPSDWTNSFPGGATTLNVYRKAFADVEADLGIANLTYLFGFQTAHSKYSSFCNCFGNPAGTYVVVDSPYNRTLTHELRLASKNDSPLTWVAGAYYYRNALQQQFRLSVLPPAVGASDAPFTTNLQHYDPTSLGLFGEVTYAVTPTTRVTGGVRSTHDHIVQDQFSVGGPPGPVLINNATNSHVDWKARVDKDLTANNLLYGTVSTGYRPGAVVQGVLTDIESVRAYEIGSKNRVGGRMTLNAAVFYYDYSGFQNVVNGAVGNVVSTIVVPLPAKFYGAELEAVVQLSFNDKLTFSPSFLSAKYTASCLTCVAGMGSSAPAPLLTDGKDIPHSPKFTVAGSYEHTFPLANGAKLTWGLDAHYQASAITDFDGSNYPTVNPRFEQGAYAIADSSLTFAPESGKYSVSLYGRNLTNRIYKTAAANGVAGGAFFVNDPLTYGIGISAKL